MNRHYTSQGIVFLSIGVTFLTLWFHNKSAGTTPPILPLLAPAACIFFLVSIFNFYKAFSN